MQQTKITRGRIAHHFAYSWWKYVAVAVVAFVGWNLLFTMTAYRPPRHKRFDAYLVAHAVGEETTNWLEAEIMQMFPSLEESRVTSIVYTNDDNYYGSIQLTTYLGAGEGDVIMLPRERFDAYARADMFLPLDDWIAKGDILVGDLDVSRAVHTTEMGNTGTFGIPMDSFYGLMEYGIDNRGLVACVLSHTPNPEYGAQWMNWLIGAMRQDMPEWLIAAEEEANVTIDEISEIPSY